MDTTDQLRSVFTEAYAVGALNRAPQGLPDGSMAIVIPKGYEAKVFPPLEKMLLRVRENILLYDADSFIRYLNTYKQQGTRIFAEPGFLSQTKCARLVAVIDYHTGTLAPDHAAHVVTYAPRYSDQWSRWVPGPGAMKQGEFAEFVEENRQDIVAPDAAKLLDIVRAFKASKKVEFNSVVYQTNGDATLVYDEKTEQTGASGPVPEQMKLGIPVYFRGPVYSVPVFVRFKVGSGAVNFLIKPDRADVIEDAAFHEVVKRVTEATGVEAYIGHK